MNKLLSKEPNYKKGNVDITAKVAQKYPVAIENARKIVANLLQDGLPGLEDTDERNRWLCQNCLTFSNVYETIEHLIKLTEERNSV